MKINLRAKVFALVLLVLSFGLGIFTYVAVNLYKSDKSSYIYESNYKQIGLVKNQLKMFIDRQLTFSLNLLHLHQLDTEFAKNLFLKQKEISSLLVLKNGKPILDLMKGGEEPLDVSKLPQDLIYSDGSDLYLSKTVEDSRFIIKTKSNILKQELGSDSIFKFFIYDINKKLSLEKIDFDLDVLSSSNLFREGQIITKEINISGEKFLVSSFQLPETAYALVSYVSQKDAFYLVNIFIQKGLYFTGFILCISLILSLFFSSRLIHPIRKLMHASQKVAMGNFDDKVEIRSNDEIAALAKSFNFMQDKIRDLLFQTKEKARIDSELKIARAVQETFIPSNFERNEYFELYGKNESASECAGDWWGYNYKNDKLFVSIADVTGHGIGPALITSSIASSSNLMFKRYKDLSPSLYLQELNAQICDLSKGRILSSCLNIKLDISKKSLQFANAAHNPGFLFRAKDIILIKDSTQLPLGNDSKGKFPNNSLEVQKDDLIFLYTDGITERKNAKGVELGDRRIQKWILKNYSLSTDLKVFSEKLLLFCKEYSSAPLEDDLSFVLLRVLK